MENASKEIVYEKVYFYLKYNRPSKNAIVLFSKNLCTVIFFLQLLTILSAGNKYTDWNLLKI